MKLSQTVVSMDPQPPNEWIEAFDHVAAREKA
jgi:hypothetical protein